MPTFRRSIELPFPREQVWAWHLRPGALARLTPPFESSEVLASGGVSDGARVEVKARILPGIDSVWTMEHFDVVAPERFRDRMLRGPFDRWEHLHAFEALSPSSTRATDEIAWQLPLGALGALGDGMVRHRLERMFAYRHATLAADLAEQARGAGRALRIAITGARGLLGLQLVPFLGTAGHTVTPLVRGAPRPGEVRWDPAGSWDATPLDGYDAVIHLAGESIAGGRWSEARKARIRGSRIDGTRSLTTQLARLPRPPRLFISASAMGIYGDRGDEELTERSTLGTDFLGEVARGWEEASAPLTATGARVVHLRFGVLLSPAGGALGKMLPAFLAGGGGRLGTGKQYMSWLALDDAIYLIHRALGDQRYAGPINAVAPAAPTNAEFTEALGRVLRRPTLVP
ncbi:MAG TPA: TIGR01777 family oxidoreductase, partial [Gemmatimonadales bacterium]|nr:TIGR01777 family oxidoreductase [Gemmatimonadales bacterium]